MSDIERGAAAIVREVAGLAAMREAGLADLLASTIRPAPKPFMPCRMLTCQQSVSQVVRPGHPMIKRCWRAVRQSPDAETPRALACLQLSPPWLPVPRAPHAASTARTAMPATPTTHDARIHDASTSLRAQRSHRLADPGQPISRVLVRRRLATARVGRRRLSPGVRPRRRSDGIAHGSHRRRRLHVLEAAPADGDGRRGGRLGRGLRGGRCEGGRGRARQRGLLRRRHRKRTRRRLQLGEHGRRCERRRKRRRRRRYVH
mmetsp:Transcript_52248/g.137442  ORF Transcript_52248/g.137442 Transcript_52248/m.137442 type:complete len:260 (-) Transcript_52248:187-966(-)